MGLLEFVRQQPEGFDTMLDPEGRRLPSSVIQKIILARSIAHRPQITLVERCIPAFSAARAERNN